MPNDAGRHLVAFALGMRCFTCLGTSENPTRHLSAAVSGCKSRSVSKLLPGGLPWAVQKAGLAADMGLQQGERRAGGHHVSSSPLQGTPIAPSFPLARGPRARLLRTELSPHLTHSPSTASG